MNLCTNAGHAIGEEGGTLRITLSSELVTPGAAAAGGTRTAGPYILLSVRDDGCGMDDDIKERIFDPFFTTKEVGVGTGLGLSTVHGIVSSLGGQIEVESEPGQGTEFRVYLPRAEGAVLTEHNEPLDTFVGSGHIMFVEDEEQLARMCTEALQRYGYSVEPYTSSVSALECFRESPASYDLVITDQTMPEVTGSKLAEQLLAIRPDLPVILCTGFSKSLTPLAVKALGVAALLEKPIGIRDLAGTVSQVLAQCASVTEG
jgi:CheY-like chemotaxis protein